MADASLRTIISGLLSWLGLACALVIGVLLPSIFLGLGLNYGGWIQWAYFIGLEALLVVSCVLLLYGGHHAIKGDQKKGGFESLTGSILLMGLFGYTYAVTPETFGNYTVLIFLPGLISALISLTTPVRVRKEKRSPLPATSV